MLLGGVLRQGSSACGYEVYLLCSDCLQDTSLQTTEALLRFAANMRAKVLHKLQVPLLDLLVVLSDMATLTYTVMVWHGRVTMVGRYARNAVYMEMLLEPGCK